MKGAAEQLQYIMRDEVLHCAFGIRVVRELLKEERMTLDPQALRELWDEAEAAEAAYAEYILREPILGYNAELHVQQFRFIANRRARQSASPSPSPAPKTSCPGSTNRPTCARRRTSSKRG
jgi:ribonucleoside-diphosphate reductase beta chain